MRRRAYEIHTLKTTKNSSNGNTNMNICRARYVCRTVVRFLFYTPRDIYRVYFIIILPMMKEVLPIGRVISDCARLFVLRAVNVRLRCVVRVPVAVSYLRYCS